MVLSALPSLVSTADLRRVAVRDRFDPAPLPKGWDALRAELVAERGAHCEMPGCGRRDLGRVFVDHKVERRDGGSPTDKANLWLLCGACHTRKTLRERVKRLRNQAAADLNVLNATRKE